MAMKTDPDCVFCKIVAREIPAAELLEDDDAFAFLDIGPLTPGHTLLIPREHYTTVDEMPGDLLARVTQHLPLLVQAVQAATGCDGVNILQNNHRIAGQLVPHVHIHIIPRRPGDAWTFNWPASEYAEGEMGKMADRIYRELERRC
jgi:histidine triad (HIT) family protein